MGVHLPALVQAAGFSSEKTCRGLPAHPGPLPRGGHFKAARAVLWAMCLCPAPRPPRLPSGWAGEPCGAVFACTAASSGCAPSSASFVGQKWSDIDRLYRTQPSNFLPTLRQAADVVVTSQSLTARSPLHPHSR